MSSEQVTAAQPDAVGKFTRALEENGLLIFTLAAFAAVVVVAVRNDLVVGGWTALVAGRWIVQHGLPSHDQFTVLAHGRRWVDVEWLGQLAFYGLWRLGGVKLALLVHALLVTSAVTGAALAARRLGATPRSVLWVSVVAMLAYYPVAWELRPQSFAFPLFVATLWLVLADARRPSPLVFAALPLIALWTNLHGSVVLGAALVSLHGLVTILRKRRPSPRGLALLLAPWACIFASPYAAHLPAYYEKILVGGHFRQFLTEWAPTTLTPITAPAYLLLLGGLWLLGRAGRNVPLLDKLVFVGAALLAFQAVRNVGWIALVAVVVLPQFLDRLRGPAFEPRRLNRFLALTMLAAVVAAVASVAAKPADWFTTKFPAGAAQAATRTAGAHGRVFATAPYADWLLWTHPELAGRIAFDGRYELLSRTQLQQLARFETRIGNWLAPVHGYRVFVLDRQSERPLARALVRALPARVIFSSPQVVVLERRTSSRP